MTVSTHYMLYGDQQLTPETSLLSQAGNAELLMQSSDGNLVLYQRPSGNIGWATNVYGSQYAGAHCILQLDGNFVVYGPSGGVLWASNTEGRPVHRAVLQDDCTFELLGLEGNVIASYGTPCTRPTTTTTTTTVDPALSFGGASDNTFLSSGYVPGVHSYTNLKDAFLAALACPCAGGVTYEGTSKTYTVRAGSNLIGSLAGDRSWVRSQRTGTTCASGTVCSCPRCSGATTSTTTGFPTVASVVSSSTGSLGLLLGLIFTGLLVALGCLVGIVFWVRHRHRTAAWPVAAAAAAPAVVLPTLARVEAPAAPDKAVEAMIVDPDPVAAALAVEDPNTSLGRAQLTRICEAETLGSLQEMLNTRADWLGHGRDVRVTSCYTRLRLAAAWRLSHEAENQRYKIAREDLLLTREQMPSGFPTVRVTTSDSAALFGLETDATINETLLLHGTKPENLAQIIANGLDERFSTGLFGDGTYFAEDAGKCDQYCTMDAHKKPGKLHETLYPGDTAHPGDVFYVLVCRAILGFVARTTDGNTRMDGGGTLWAPGGRRELRDIPGSDPPRPYHALLVEEGSKVARYREIIIFHSERVVAEFLVAYQRR